MAEKNVTGVNILSSIAVRSARNACLPSVQSGLRNKFNRQIAHLNGNGKPGWLDAGNVRLARALSNVFCH